MRDNVDLETSVGKRNILTYKIFGLRPYQAYLYQKSEL